MTYETLLEKLHQKTATIAVIGLGYVGLPLLLRFANAGYKTIGIDSDPKKQQALQAGKSYLKHIPDSAIAAEYNRPTFRVTTDIAAVSEADATIMCLPTPLTRHREPDLTYIVHTTEKMVPHLRAGQLHVLESTTYPGTTTEVFLPILETSGLKNKNDFFVAFSPEREDPGNAHYNTQSIPKIVGGDGEKATQLAEALYKGAIDKTVLVSSPAVAEAVKLTENIFRSVNIALVNELKVIYDAMGIDVWEVINAAKTKPFGYMPFYPGPGLGGHCIPIDPFYLTWKAREFEINTRFIELAGEINVSMPRYVVEKTAQALDKTLHKGLSGARILLLGMAYKKNVDDMRESPALKVLELLEARGAKVDYHDPFVSIIPPTREHPTFTGRASVPCTPQTINGYDALVVVTDHDGVDYKMCAEHAKLIIDTRNVFAAVTTPKAEIVKA